MKKYQPMKPTVRQCGEYCTIQCGNRGCRVNLANCPKGEKFTVRRYYGTERCRGYRVI